MKLKEKKYKAHCENLQTIESAIKMIENNLKERIKRKDFEGILIYTRLLSFLVGCWQEVRLEKIIHEPNAYSESEVNLILSCSSLADSWKKAVRISICKKCNVRYNEDTNLDEELKKAMPFTIGKMYEQVLEWLDLYIKDVYEIRNKIAHGQWNKAFTNDLSKFSPERTKDLKQENIVAIQIKRKVMLEVTYLLESLCVSNVPKESTGSIFRRTESTAFEKNFEQCYKHINHLLERRQADREYDEYVRILVEKYERGKNHKKNNQ